MPKGTKEFEVTLRIRVQRGVVGLQIEQLISQQLTPGVEYELLDENDQVWSSVVIDGVSVGRPECIRA